ncbi:MAG: GMC family oxidoreductase [Pseudomonadota bacterium]
MRASVAGRTLDLSKADGPLTRRAEFCVVGAGVAGQTLARRLAEHGRTVLLVESGGREVEAAQQDLAAGEVAGFPYYPLEDSRLRLFGGTTAIWGGRCAALDPIDFERRAWVPHSGWPIGHADLDPYVDAAFAALGVERRRDWSGLQAPRPPFDPELIDVPLWSFDDRDERFTDPRRLDLPGVEIALNATLTAIETGESGAVTSLGFRSLSGRSLTVTAERYVLAAGGIETVRLLLACAPRRPDGLGNARDLLGRFFMEHPHARGGRILPSAPGTEGHLAVLRIASAKIRHGSQRLAAAFRPAEAAQRRLGLLNTAVSLAVRRHEGAAQAPLQRMIGGLKHELPALRALRASYRIGKRVAWRLKQSGDARRAASRAARREAVEGHYAVVRAEQAPNPDSRVRLVAARDALGVRRVALDWRFSPLDRASVAGLMALLDGELRRLGVACVSRADWLREDGPEWKIDPLISSHAIGGYHHMGGARMAAGPSEGVVDADCRLFECPNLHLAGSAVFPTCGWANPTITIMALALRLGDRLGART